MVRRRSCGEKYAPVEEAKVKQKMREAVKGKEEDPAQRIPYTITNKLTKACFAEYDSSFTENGTGKTAWLDGQRSLIDAEKQDVLQWVMVGGEGFLKPAPDGTGRLAYHVVRRDCYNVLARGPHGITDVLMSERSRAGSDYYTLLERRTVDGSGYLTIRYNLYVSENSSTLGHEVRLDSLPQYAALAPEHTYSVPFGGLGMTYIRLPMANNVDGSPDGVSVYEGAVQLIHNIYKNEYQLGREFELGRSRIVAGSDMLMTPGPEGGVMRLKDDVFVGLDGDASVGMTIFSPTLRDESFERRKQSYLKACENIIGLKRGILSDVEAVERTARTPSRGSFCYAPIYILYLKGRRLTTWHWNLPKSFLATPTPGSWKKSWRQKSTSCTLQRRTWTQLRRVPTACRSS